VSHNGEFFTETIVKAEEHLKTKKIFVLWHWDRAILVNLFKQI
jgi:hypothetical protein